MVPQLPPGGPSWLGWVLFAVAVGVLLTREITSGKTARAEREKSKIEAQKMSLDILKDSAESYERQINAIATALDADAVHLSDAQIEAVRAGWPGYGESHAEGRRSLADHLGARATARRELPMVIGQLTAVQKRQVDLSRDLSQGVAVQDSILDDVRTKTEGLAAQLGELVRLVATSPRIHVVEEGSEPSAEQMSDGDIVAIVPRGSLSAGGSTTSSPPEPGRS